MSAIVEAEKRRKVFETSVTMGVNNNVEAVGGVKKCQVQL
jgi:hypothetical protein